jgi:hypothetical protein
MAITANQLTKQVDLPVWEWTRPLPIATTNGLSAFCNADNTQFNEVSGRYIYTLANATNFFRYDTIADTYQQLASPGVTPLTATSIQYAGAQGYYGRVISATSNTIQTGLPNNSAIGYRIRITSGRGAGQERLITAVSNPTVHDWGGCSAASAVNITDASKDWGRGSAGTTTQLNGWVGYVVRTTGGTGINQVRKILYNTATILTIADPTIYAWDTFCSPTVAGTLGMATTAIGTQYQIESSVITVDTAWTVTPDSTSRYVIQSGGIYMASGATVVNGGLTMQYYSVLEDVWYAKSVNNSMVPILSTDCSLERFTENSSIWYNGRATSGTVTTLTDSDANWTVNQWAGYQMFIWTGTGRAQIATITSNTSTVLTFPTLGTAPDSTSEYQIVGYDGGTLTASVGRIVSDSSKNWAVNRWANYAVRIVAGTGDGQMRQILSNGADSLVVYDPWNIQPDNTSIYLIQAWTDDMFITIGGNSQTFLYHVGESDMVSNGRILDEGTVQVACAMLTDDGTTSTHVIYQQKPVAIASISGTTTITATTTHPHQFKVGQRVSIRGVTNANNAFNVNGKVEILTVPSTTTFTYTPFGAGTGTYQYSDNVTVGVSVLPDASKTYSDSATGGSTTTVTFTRATPSNINGWYAYGTNIAAGAQIQSGAGTTTLTFNLTGGGTPTGIIFFYKYPRPVTLGTAGGGGAGTFTATSTSTIPAYCKGWQVAATNTGIGAYLTGGEGGTTASLSIQNSGAVSGTFTLYHPTNLPLPATGTYSSNSNSTTITFASATPSYITDWYVSGTNIGNGAKVVSGAGTATITVSTAHSGTPSGTITFYPPTQTSVMMFEVGAAPVYAATGLLAAASAMQLVTPNTTNPTVFQPIGAFAAVAAGLSRYIVAKRDMFGQYYDGQNLNYLSGVALGTQSTTTLVDTNSFWATATGSGGSAGATTFTISAIGSIIHNGWFVSGTGIPLGARVLSGGGTTSITIDQPLTGAVSGTITFTAWSVNGLLNRTLRVVSSTGTNQQLLITAVAPTTGTLTFALATAALTAVSTYSILPTVIPGAGTNLRWQFNSSVPADRGRNLFRFRGNATVGFDRIDLTNDLLYFTSYTPNTETLGAGSMYAYDGVDRIYFTKDVTNRCYYIDLTTDMIYGAGLFPYVAGTAGVGNRMEVFTTVDGLKYLFVGRQGAVETFRQLVFY